MRPRWIAALVAVCAACQAPPPPEPFEGRPQADQLDPEEQRIWDNADRMRKAIEASCGVVRDPELEGYAVDLLDRLFPELAGSFRFRILAQPQVNAIVLADGSIYFFTGILARLENEAQFAAVLAHEGVHFERRHVYADRTRERRASFDSTFARSREQESEADRLGIERLAAAGYDPLQAARAIEHLAEIERLYELVWRTSTATHPDTERRVAELDARAADLPAEGRIERAAYLERTAGVRLAALEESLARFDHRLVLLALESEGADEAYPPYVDFYRGEAYRMRGEEGDLERAEAAYLRALDRDPLHAPTRRALGRHYLKIGEHDAAARHLSRFLELAPDDLHAEFVRAELGAAEEAR